MAGLKRIHPTDQSMQEHPPKKICNEDDSIHDNLLTQANNLVTALRGADSRDSMETRLQPMLLGSKPANLDNLPNEILTRIFISSHEPSLIHVCRNTLYVLPSYIWYSSSLAMLALLGTVTVGKREDGDASKVPKHVMWKLLQVTGPKFRVFLNTSERTDPNYSVLTSKWFGTAEYEVTYDRLAKIVASAALKYLPFPWKKSHVVEIHQQFARTKNMEKWQTLRFSDQTPAGQGQSPRSSVIIDSTGITQVLLSQRPVHGMKFRCLSYIPNCLLAVSVKTHQPRLIANALSFFNTDFSSRPEGRPACSRSLLREALLEVISRPIESAGSPAHKEADDTFQTLLSLDKITSTSAKYAPATDDELIQAVLANDWGLYLYQMLKAFAVYKHIAVQTLKFFEGARGKTPNLSKECRAILQVELMTRAMLQRSDPPPERMHQSFSHLRSVLDAKTKYRYIRLSLLRHRNEDQIFTIGVYYTRRGRWLYGGSWHIPGAEHLYKTMPRRQIYGRRATLRSYAPTRAI